MKKLFLSLAILTTSLCFSQAISLTGQLTIGDANNIGNTGNYIKCKIVDGETTNIPVQGATTRTDAITVSVCIYKSKASYNNNKPPLQPFDSQITNEIRSSYTISAATIASSPTANFNALSGHTLRDKQLFWVLTQVLNQIIADNPTFTGSVVDVNL